MSTLVPVFKSVERYRVRIERLLKSRFEILAFIWYRHFKRTGNPLFAWEAYSYFRRGALIIPPEIMAYLDEVADEIIEIANAPPAAAGGKRAAALSRALKLHGTGRGKGSRFNEYRKYFYEITIALEIYEEVKDYEGVEDYPIENVAKEYKISPSTARRIYKKHSKTFLPR